MKCPKCGTEFYGDKCPKCGYEPTEYDIAIDTLMQLTGVGRKRAEELYKAGYKDIESIAKSDEKDLAEVNRIGKELAKKIKNEASKYIEEENEEFVRICPVCGAIVPPGADKCPKCGTPVEEFDKIISGRKKGEEKKDEKIGEQYEEDDSILNKAICPACGALIPKDSKVCPVCGANLEGLKLEEPTPMEDPNDVLKKFFGVSEIPKYKEQEEEEADIRVCPNCGAIVVNKEVCPFCGTPLPKVEKQADTLEDVDLSETLKVCPNCGAFIPPDVDTCPVCGASLEGEKTEEEESISLGALLNPTQLMETPEREEEDIGMEELAEIESTLGEELKEEQAKAVEEEVELSDLDEIMRSMEEKEELAEEDLKKIEEEIMSEKKETNPITTPPPKVSSPASSPSPVSTTPLPVKEKSFSDKLNTFLHEFGTLEDILSFTPLLITLVFILSINALSGVAADIFTGTVSIVSLSLGFLLALYSYASIKKFNKMEIIIGGASTFIILLIFLPYAAYILIAGGAVLIYLYEKKGFDYWIPYTVATIAFSLQTQHAVEYGIIFASMFSSHIILRFRETNIGIAPESTLSSAKLYEEGMKAFREKRYYDSIYLLRRALKSNPRDVNVLNTLGLAYGRIGNSEMAIEMFKKVVGLKPDYKFAWNNMGNVYARMENYDKAIECYKKALEIDPNYDDAMLNLGYVMIRRGNYGEALKITEKIKAAT